MRPGMFKTNIGTVGPTHKKFWYVGRTKLNCVVLNRHTLKDEDLSGL